MLPETEQWHPDPSTADGIGVPRAKVPHEMPLSVPTVQLWNGKWHLRVLPYGGFFTLP